MKRKIKDQTREKKKKSTYVDDGHTIYPMDIDGMPNRRIQTKDSVGLNKKERRAAIHAAFMTYLPALLFSLLGFILAMVVIYFWLT